MSEKYLFIMNNRRKILFIVFLGFIFVDNEIFCLGYSATQTENSQSSPISSTFVYNEGQNEDENLQKELHTTIDRNPQNNIHESSSISITGETVNSVEGIEMGNNSVYREKSIEKSQNQNGKKKNEKLSRKSEMSDMSEINTVEIKCKMVQNACEKKGTHKCEDGYTCGNESRIISIQRMYNSGLMCCDTTQINYILDGGIGVHGYGDQQCMINPQLKTLDEIESSDRLTLRRNDEEKINQKNSQESEIIGRELEKEGDQRRLSHYKDTFNIPGFGKISIQIDDNIIVESTEENTENKESNVQFSTEHTEKGTQNTPNNPEHTPTSSDNISFILSDVLNLIGSPKILPDLKKFSSKLFYTNILNSLLLEDGDQVGLPNSSVDAQQKAIDPAYSHPIPVQTIDSNDENIDNIDENIDSIDENVDNIDENVDNIDENVDNIDENIDNIDENMDNTDEHIDNIDENIDNIDENIDNIDENIDNIDENIDNIDENIGNNDKQNNEKKTNPIENIDVSNMNESNSLNKYNNVFNESNTSPIDIVCCMGKQLQCDTSICCDGNKSLCGKKREDKDKSCCNPIEVDPKKKTNLYGDCCSDGVGMICKTMKPCCMKPSSITTILNEHIKNLYIMGLIPNISIFTNDEENGKENHETNQKINKKNPLNTTSYYDDENLCQASCNHRPVSRFTKLITWGFILAAIIILFAALRMCCLRSPRQSYPTHYSQDREWPQAVRQKEDA